MQAIPPMTVAAASMIHFSSVFWLETDLVEVEMYGSSKENSPSVEDSALRRASPLKASPRPSITLFWKDAAGGRGRWGPNS